MNKFTNVGAVYLHREPVVFRKPIDDLSIIVKQSLDYRSSIHHYLFFQ
jgi:hypothetical protein